MTTDLIEIEAKGITGLDEMKIGVIAKTVFRKVLEEGKVTKEEVELLQTKEYSREKLHTITAAAESFHFPRQKAHSVLCQTGENPRRRIFHLLIWKRLNNQGQSQIKYSWIASTCLTNTIGT